MKIKVVYEKYQRYEPGAPSIGHISAPTFREAIIKMLSKVRMYQDEETILEWEEEHGRLMSDEEIIDALYSENGDGCDYIFQILNEETGEVYLNGNYEFEEWEL